jgi:NAD(P)-dependent dehydrogenase (short-subunit alcohol dehydrogenase family)
MSHQRQIVLITGANRGIGFAIAQRLAQPKYTVIITARSLEKAQAAASSISKNTDDVIGLQLDVEDSTSIEACAKEVEHKYGRLDVLIHNAGMFISVYRHSSKTKLIIGVNNSNDIKNGKIDEVKGWASSYHINVIGPHVATRIFAPLLLKSPAPRVLFISSSAGSLGLDADSNLGLGFNSAPEAGWPKEDNHILTSYRPTKSATNMVMRDWYRIFKNDGVKVHALCPGRVATDFGSCTVEEAKQQGGTPVEQPAVFVEAILDGKWDEHQGEFIHEGGVYPW